jgi:hypothetical protein
MGEQGKGGQQRTDQDDENEDGGVWADPAPGGSHVHASHLSRFSVTEERQESTNRLKATGPAGFSSVSHCITESLRHGYLVE